MSVHLKNDSDTVVIVLHEIYGINPNIKEKCAEFHAMGLDVICPDMLKTGRYYPYEDEEEAYDNFINMIGIEDAADYISDILKIIRSSYKHIVVVGYSIGATIAWLCSRSGYCDGVVCYYGSRIRDYLTIKQRCPIQLYFAERERTFDVYGLVEVIKNHDYVDFVGIYEAEHGFADPYSTKYDHASFTSTRNQLSLFLQDIRKTNTQLSQSEVL